MKLHISYSHQLYCQVIVSKSGHLGPSEGSGRETVYNPNIAVVQVSDYYYYTGVLRYKGLSYKIHAY